MPLSEEHTKEALVITLQLLRDHDAEISRLSASLQAALNILDKQSPEFRSQFEAEKRILESGEKPFSARNSQLIDGLIALIRSA